MSYNGSPNQPQRHGNLSEFAFDDLEKLLEKEGSLDVPDEIIDTMNETFGKINFEEETFSHEELEEYLIPLFESDNDLDDNNQAHHTESLLDNEDRSALEFCLAITTAWKYIDKLKTKVEGKPYDHSTIASYGNLHIAAQIIKLYVESMGLEQVNQFNIVMKFSHDKDQQCDLLLHALAILSYEAILMGFKQTNIDNNQENEQWNDRLKELYGSKFTKVKMNTLRQFFFDPNYEKSDKISSAMSNPNRTEGAPLADIYQIFRSAFTMTQNIKSMQGLRIKFRRAFLSIVNKVKNQAKKRRRRRAAR